MKELIQIPAQLILVQSRADRTWKLTFNTPELGADAGKLTEQLMNQGWLLFSPNDDIELEDIPEITAEATDSKSPSQRLRSVLYVFWEQRGKQGSFEQFYLVQMSRLIDSIKDKLDD